MGSEVKLPGIMLSSMAFQLRDIVGQDTSSLGLILLLQNGVNRIYSTLCLARLKWSVHLKGSEQRL